MYKSKKEENLKSTKVQKSTQVQKWKVEKWKRDN